jgi:dissimilatory sulfite reductase alpha subunit
MAEELPYLDELTQGPWPSFITEMKKVSDRKPMVADLLRQLEASYEDGISYWEHGGIVGVMGYGGGVIGRYSSRPDDFPDVSHFHTIRVNQPSGWFYTSDALRTLCDICDKYGSGLTNMHGSTGDIVFLGSRTEDLEDCFLELAENGWDLGGSGSNMRTPSCCLGPARCEWACYDTNEACYKITQDFQDELHRPFFPYKYKFKFAGCPNDCVASIARSDCSVIGTWRDDIRQNDAEVTAWAANNDMVEDVTSRCPTSCMSWDGAKLTIDNPNCVRCMHCINVMPKALKPGTDRGAAILIGAKAPIVQGALLATVIVPFMKMDDDFEALEELTEKIWDWWGEHGKNRERIGELIQRMGMGSFLKAIDLEPDPKMVKAPRDNPYIYYEEYYDEDEDDEEEDE